MTSVADSLNTIESELPGALGGSLDGAASLVDALRSTASNSLNTLSSSLSAITGVLPNLTGHDLNRAEHLIGDLIRDSGREVGSIFGALGMVKNLEAFLGSSTGNLVHRLDQIFMRLASEIEEELAEID